MDTVKFVRQFPVRPFLKGELVMGEGELLTKLLAIKDGFIKITSLDENGVERLLWIAGRYDLVPSEQFFSKQSALSYFYTALTDGSAYEVDKAEFLEHTKSNLQLMTDVATSMSAHYDDLLLRVNSVEQPSVHDKLVATLRYLAERFSAKTTVDLHALGLPLTHQDLAEMIGSTRETASLELQKLRQEGCIDYDRNKFVIFLEKCSIPSIG